MNNRPDTFWDSLAMFVVIAVVFAFAFAVFSGWLP
jgi:hypothetical protein